MALFLSQISKMNEKLSIYFLTENSIFRVQISQAKIAKIAKSLVVGIGIEHNFASIIEVNIVHFQKPLNLALPRCFYFKRPIMCSIVRLYAFGRSDFSARRKYKLGRKIWILHLYLIKWLKFFMHVCQSCLNKCKS